MTIAQLPLNQLGSYLEIDEDQLIQGNQYSSREH